MTTEPAPAAAKPETVSSASIKTANATAVAEVDSFFSAHPRLVFFVLGFVSGAAVFLVF